MAAGKKYAFGVEALAGLVAGASALAALVVVMVLFLLVRENTRWSNSLATGVAARIAVEIGTQPDQAGLEAACRGLVPSDGLATAVYLDSLGEPLFAYPEFSHDRFNRSEWVFVPARTTGTIGVLPAKPPVVALAGPVLAALAFICLALAITALMMPAYLRSRVIDPLRNLLLEADRYRSGSGTSPGAASVSFHELVTLLSEKERELDTLRIQAVARAELAESRAGAVLETLDSAVAALDSSGRVILWNARASELFGLSEEDRGNPFPRERTPIAGGADYPKGEVAFRGRAYRVKTLAHSNGEMILTATDITDALQMERRLAEERYLADLGAFSGGVVHEIGNTLCAMKGFLELLSRGMDDSRTGRIMAEARLELDAASGVVDAFRTLAGREGPEFTLVSAGDLAASIGDECSGSGVPFVSRDICDGRIRTDAVLLARCVRNLLDNALEYCPPEEIRVTMTCSDRLVIQVSDSGPGLPEPPDIVFRPLYSTGREKGHMGIGLTVSRRIILAMGGEIEPQNTGKGASFVITLPREDRI